jgi:oligo-1,6-glucosidase
MVPGTPGAEPNQWGGTFGGSAWQYDETRGEYYLHTFSKKQPDLNWENPAVRHAVYDMMNWWLDRGIDGFRMDVITLISKRIDENGRLPGESHGLIADEAPGEEGYSSPWPFSMDGPRLDEFLKEMRRQVFEGREGYLTVGEGQGISPKRNEHITDPSNGELDMLFLFDHVGVDQGAVKWDIQSLQLPKLKRAMIEQQEAVAGKGWASLYFNNHDQPRALSRWGDTSTAQLRVKSAKALAVMLHMHKGTPYVYQGEELGMTNAGFTNLDQYRDLESINAFHQRVDEAQVQTSDSMLASLSKVSRDNSRTPMQWDDTRYAAFTSSDSPHAPWLPVNENKRTINAQSELRDPDSVFAFYQRLIELRHTDDLIAAGSFEAIDVDDRFVYAFKRSLGSRSVLVAVNTASHTVALPEQTYLILASGIDPSKVLLSNEDVESLGAHIAGGELAPWSAFVYEI